MSKKSAAEREAIIRSMEGLKVTLVPPEPTRDEIEARIRRAKAGVPILRKPTLLDRFYLLFGRLIAGKQDDDRSDGMGVGQ